MTSKDTLTNAQALALALDLARDAGNEQLVAKLEHMHKVATKPRSKSKTLTSEQRQMLQMVDEFIDKLQEHVANGGDSVGTDWISQNVKFCGSSQKASAIAKKAIAAGAVKKAEPVKGKVRYTIA